MLVLSRKIGEAIQIGSEIEIVVLSTGNGRVKIGFSAPKDVRIARAELAVVPAINGSAPAPESMPVARRTGSMRSSTAPLAGRFL